MPPISMSTRKVATLPSTDLSNQRTVSPPTLSQRSKLMRARPVMPLSSKPTSRTVVLSKAKTTGKNNTDKISIKKPLSSSSLISTYKSFAYKNPYSNSTTVLSSQAKVPDLEPLPFLDYRTNDSREVMYTKCDVEADQWLQSNTSKMWALDAEWRPLSGYGKQGKMSLIQLGDDKTVYLFHVIHMKKFPEVLARILADSYILKVGINIRNDATKLLKDWGVECASLVELGALSIQVQDNILEHRKIRSMGKLSRELLRHDVEKVPLTRTGNWESKSLSANQIAYAANDVFVTYELAEKIMELQRTRQRPTQEYVLPLATVHKNGATVVMIKGSLQERINCPPTVEDIIVPKTKQSLIVAKSAAKSSTEAKRSSMGYTKISRVNTGRSHLPTKRAPISPPLLKLSFPSTTTHGNFTRISVTPASSIKSKLPSGATMATDMSHPTNTFKLAMDSEPPFLYQNSPSSFGGKNISGTNDEIRTVRLSSQSSVTIIPPRFQKRKFSSFVFVQNNKITEVKEISEWEQPENSNNVYFPRRLLPESLEEKDILERNQSIWQEAGGRDLLEDAVQIENPEENDWHLRQNQALFASLTSQEIDTDANPELNSDLGLNKDDIDILSILQKKS
ncbi:hypothetical protein FBU30_010652 [Linnemannia zychae]|nr:hypothetical protein FBU30_010652 [Linnemannia zychae]